MVEILPNLVTLNYDLYGFSKLKDKKRSFSRHQMNFKAGSFITSGKNYLDHK